MFPANIFNCNSFFLVLLVVAALDGCQNRSETPPAQPPVSQTVPSPTPSPRPPSPANAQLADPQLEKRVDDLLAKLTLDEKIGQLTLYTAGTMTGPGTGKTSYNDRIIKGEVGALFNVVGASITNQYQHLAIEQSPHHIPLLFGFDVIHGDRTIYPVPLALSCSFDPELVRNASHLAAQESCEDGVRWVYSPMVDIARDPRWGRIVESAGEDTYLGCALARAYVQGYQDSDLSQPGSVAACVKHFAAYGAPLAGREYNTVDMSELTLRQFYLPTYHAAVEAGAASVMTAFNALNGVPASCNPFLLTEILRNEWHFNGMVVSDFTSIRELYNHGVSADDATSCVKALSAGLDMDMESDLYHAHLADLVHSGQLPESVVDEAARRVLRLKFALGLFDHPYVDESQPAYTATQQKRQFARAAAEETLVLLKNQTRNGASKPILPLDKKTPVIALIGPLADSQLDMIGSWAGAGDLHDCTTLKTSLEEHCKQSKTRLIYTPGTEVLGTTTTGFNSALNAARKATVVILALGESAQTMSGEASSQTRLDLPGNQEALLEAVAKIGKPTVLVLFDGRPLSITWAADHIPAILQAWYPGMEAGPAVADILFGDANPSAKLTTTFPRAVGQEPLFYNELPTGRPADGYDLSHPPLDRDEKYFSRYIDENNAPLYTFGDGLTYTQFSYSIPVLSQNKISAQAFNVTDAPAPTIKVSVDLKNTGSRRGVEIAQLYIRNTAGGIEEPLRELRGFQRIALDPGQTQHLEFTLGFDELAYYTSDLKRRVSPSKYQVWVGGSSTTVNGTGFVVTP